MGAVGLNARCRSEGDEGGRCGRQGAHSNKLAKKERISEISTHNVRPDSVDKYLKTQANLIGFINSQKDVLHGECLGNFNVLVGDQDQFLHIWRYEGGYKAID